MDEYQSAKLAGAQIFRQAIVHIKQHGWQHNSMEILLSVSNGERWAQPMAVLMFSALSDALGHETLTQFDTRVTDPESAIQLFESATAQLESSYN